MKNWSERNSDEEIRNKKFEFFSVTDKNSPLSSVPAQVDWERVCAKIINRISCFYRPLLIQLHDPYVLSSSYPFHWYY